MPNLARYGLALLLPLAACNANPPPPPATAMPAMPQVSAQDENFAATAAASDQFEIQSAQIALRKSRNPAVRQFAQRMINDHTKTTQQLTAIAQAKSITPRPELNGAQQRMITELQNAPARNFNYVYWQQAVASHQDAVRAFQGEAQDGYDADLKGFAQRNLPTIQSHLAMAQQHLPG